MKWIYLSIGATIFLGVLAGCGGSSSQPQPSLTLSPAMATPQVTGTVQLIYTVNNTPDTGVSWYVDGIANGNATVGTVQVLHTLGKVPNGGTITIDEYFYVAPVVVPSPATVTVTVTLNSPSLSATSTITVLRPQFNLASLKGTFVFSLNGFDKNGFPFFAAGSFVGDGNGQVINGEEDLNSVAHGYSRTTNITGSYNVGSDGRGTITLNSSLGSFAYAFVLAGPYPVIPVVARLIEMDQSGSNSSGDMELQDTPFAFPPLPLPFQFAYIYRGQNSSGTQFASVGSFTLQSGAITGSQDMNFGGTVSLDQSLDGSYGSTDALGRGTASFSTNTGTANIVYYLISGSKVSGTMRFRFVSTDAQVPFVGRAEEQFIVPFRDSDFNGNQVLSISANTQAGPSFALLQFNASTGTVTSGYHDVNDAGSISSSLVTGTYTLYPSGKVSGSFTVSGVSFPFSIYLIGYYFPSRHHIGYYLDLRSNAVGTGYLYPILAGNNSAGNWLGNYAVMQSGFFLPPVASNVSNATGEIFSDGNENLTGNEDFHDPLGNLANQAANGTYSMGRAAPGRGTASITTSVGTRNYVIYVTDPTQVLLLGVDPTLPLAGEAVRQY
jgi:hypothetical protein